MNAVILAAGKGMRLRPLTYSIPKCFLMIGKKSILESMLLNLAWYDVDKVAIVVGHLGGMIRDKIGNRYAGMEITYIENKDYENTNSAYSLWLARDFLKDECFVIEADCFMDKEGFRLFTRNKIPNKSYWIVDHFDETWDGCMLTTEKRSDKINDIRIIRDKEVPWNGNNYKSTGIVFCNKKLGEKFSVWLGDRMSRGDVNVYYDLVLAEHVNDSGLNIFDIYGYFWKEIDTVDDYEGAIRYGETKDFIPT